MLKPKYISALMNSGYRTRISLIFGLGLLCSNVMLVIFMQKISTAEKTIVIPAGFNQPITVEGNSLDKSYMSQMTRYTLQLLKNYHPDSAKAQFDEAVRYMVPHYYSQLKAYFSAEENRIQRNQIASVWYPIGTHVTRDMVYQTGELKGMIGSQVVSDEVKTYGIQWSFKNGKMEIVKIGVYVKDPRGQEWIEIEDETLFGQAG